MNDEIKKPTTNPENEPVTLTKGQLQGILNELNSLKNRGAVKKPKRVTQRTAYLRFHQGLPVSWMGNVRELRDDKTAKMYALADLKLYEKEDEPVTVNYLDFLNASNQVKVLIKDQEAERLVLSEGEFRVENPDPMNKKNFRSTETDAEVVTYRYTVTVEVMDGEHAGKTFKLPSTALNL